MDKVKEMLQMGGDGKGKESEIDRQLRKEDHDSLFTPEKRTWRPPLVGWLKGYSRRDLYADLLCGLTIGFMSIPQGLSDAVIIGIPAYYGLYAAFLSVIPYIFLGTSPHVSVGPTTIVSLLVNIAVEKILPNGYPKTLTPTSKTLKGLTPEEIDVQISVNQTQQMFVLQNIWLITFFSGVFITALGFLRLGYLVNFLSRTVLSGFCAAAALVISAQQLKNLFGMKTKARSPVWWNMMRHLHNHQDEIGGSTTGLSFLFLLMLLLGKYLGKNFKRLAPIRAFAPMICLIIGMLVEYNSRLNHNYEIAIVGYMPKGMPKGINPFTKIEGCLATPNSDGTCSSPPDFDYTTILETAILVSLFGYLEHMAIGNSVSMQYEYRLDANMEAICMGFANFLNSFFQGFPVNGSLSRTVVAASVDGRTPLSNIVVFLCVIIVINALTRVFSFIPMLVLAAIIVSACVGMFTWSEAIHLFRTAKIEFGLYMFSFLATLFLGVELGLGLAILLSIIRILADSCFPRLTVLGYLPQSPTIFKAVEKAPDAVVTDHVHIIRIDAPIHFVNISFIKTQIHTLILKYNADKKHQPLPLLPRRLLGIVPLPNPANTEDSFQQKVSESIDHIEKGADAPSTATSTTRARTPFSFQRSPSRTILSRESMFFGHLLHRIKYIILDFSPVVSIDAAGVLGIEELFKECQSKGVILYFCNVQDPVYDAFVASNLAEKFFRNDSNFHSTFDALQRCTKSIHGNKQDS